MPIIQVTLIEGYSKEVRADLSRRLTAAARAATGAGAEGVTVVLNEAPAANYMRASDVVRAYLAAMEARDLDTARGYLGPGFAMIFPGGVCFSTPEQLAEWAAGRYRFVRKAYEGFDEAHGPDADTVFCHGTLSGEWPDGTAFSGVRFIDRFTVSAGLLSDQRVWNDLAESRS